MILQRYTGSKMIDYFECDCGSDEHRFCVTSEMEEDGFPPQLYFHLQLHQYRNILQRMWVATKYIFGYKSKYGHWDTINISPDDVERLMVLFHQHKVRMKNFNKERQKND
jgi:hypothetical protein